MARHTLAATFAATLIGGFGALALTSSASAQCDPGIVSTLDPQGTSWDVRIVGDIMYYCDGEQGLHIYLLGPSADPANPALLGTLQIPAYQIAVDGTRAYVTSGSGVIGSNDLQIVDVSVPGAPALLGAVTLPSERPQNVVASNGYAYVGLVDTVAIIDATVPTVPTVAGTLGVIASSAKVALAGDVLFVTHQDGTLHAWDVSNPFAPVDIGQAPSGFDHSAITISGEHLYLTANNLLGIVDISDPANMTSTLQFTGLFAGPNRGIEVIGGVGYLIESDRLIVIDLSQPMQPAQLGTMTLPANSNTAFVAARQAFVYVSQPQQDVFSVVDVATCPTAPLITTQPQSVVANTGGAAVSFNIAVSFFSNIQWRHNGVPIADRGPYTGTTTTSLTVMPSLTTEGVYDAVVFNGQGSVTSIAAGLVVINPCPADIVSSATFAPPPDGIVDGADLAALLGAWGTCN